MPHHHRTRGIVSYVAHFWFWNMSSSSSRRIFAYSPPPCMRIGPLCWLTSCSLLYFYLFLLYLTPAILSQIPDQGAVIFSPLFTFHLPQLSACWSLRKCAARYSGISARQTCDFTCNICSTKRSGTAFQTRTIFVICCSLGELIT